MHSPRRHPAGRADFAPVRLRAVELGDRGKPVTDVIDAGSTLVFGAINIVMKLAPIGAFGAMAFTIGRYGIARWPARHADWHVLPDLRHLRGGVLGPDRMVLRLHIFRFLAYIKEEILIVSAPLVGLALAVPDGKLERLGCSKPVVGLVRPDRLRLQHRRHQHLHDDGGPVRGPGDQHRADA